MRNNSTPPRTIPVIFLCFFFSGAAGLVYQVAWGKALGLVFGHTVYAIATVLAVFMGGLALGSAVLGRWSETRAHPVALYGWVELGVAATGALSLAGLAGVRILYLATYHAVAGSTPALIGLRFLGSAVVLLLPTFLMGGTLPILVRGLTRASTELGARVSRLYWVNTLGAVAGTLAAGFFLLPAIGLKGTVALAVALNVLAGVTALVLGRAMPAVAPAAAESQPAHPGALSRMLLVTFAMVGATALAYEIAWTRLLATTLGSSTYAFTLMLATFLAGIVLGSALFERWLGRGHQASLATFATTQTLTALAALVFLGLYQQLPQVVPPLLRATHQTFGGLIFAQFVTSALAMLPAAVIFGFNFPAVTLLVAGRPETSGRYAAAVGRAYAANTLGAILGATATGFWLVPKLGSFQLLALTAAANLLLAVILQLRRTPRAVVAVTANAAALLAVAAIAWSGVFYDRALANFGTVLYWQRHKAALSVPEMAATTDIVFAEDGLNASISVARSEAYLALRTNGKVDASTKDIATQLLVGHLGAIFHPAPKRVLVIGFGSGMTVSAVALYPEVERIDCVEIEPAVIRAARYLEPLERGVLQDPRLHLYLDDARNFLLTTRERYDLIVSEPSNPWIAGVAALFTDEFYREARARLHPGGIFVQWIQAYALYPQDLRMVFATFLPHFPRVTLWRGESPDYMLLAQTQPEPLAFDRLRTLWSNPRLRGDFETLGMRRPEGMTAFHLLDDADVRRLAAGSLCNTDDHTRLEYRAPRALLALRLDILNRELVWQKRSAALPRDIRVDDPQTALVAAGETLLNLGEDTEASYFLERVSRDSLTPEAAVALGRWELEKRQLDRSKADFETALHLDKNRLAAVQGLAEVARQKQEYDTAELLLRQLLARDPNSPAALTAMVQIERAREHWLAATLWQARRIAADPKPDSNEFARLGELLLRAGDTNRGERAFFAALERDPYNYAAHRNLAELCRQQKRWDEARRHLELVVRYEPEVDATLYAELAEVYRAIGRDLAARSILRKGLRLFPDDTNLQRAYSAS